MSKYLEVQKKTKNKKSKQNPNPKTKIKKKKKIDDITRHQEIKYEHKSNTPQNGIQKFEQFEKPNELNVLIHNFKVQLLRLNTHIQTPIYTIKVKKKFDLAQST